MKSRRGAPLPQENRPPTELGTNPRPLWEARSAGRPDLTGGHNNRRTGAGVIEGIDFRGHARRICGIDPDPRVVDKVSPHHFC